MKRLIYLIPLAFLLSLFFPRCAVVVRPVGGPKDTIPPQLIRSNPKIYSTNFKGDRVVLTFDEFFRLDQLSQKLILSPPQERLPEPRIRGKSLELRFYEELLDSTTYTLYFSDAIIDNNEGNKLKNFEFAFSTGHEIDSMRLTGKVVDAFSKEPQEAVLVMLYEKFKDSLPMLQLPRYVTKTTKEGEFVLSNLKYRSYKIFALLDENTNYKFDQITEKIAFLNEIIDTSYLFTPHGDSLGFDPEKSINLRLFQEENRLQSLINGIRPQRGKLTFSFTRKPKGGLKVTPLNFDVDTTKQWFIEERNLAGDSLHYWLTDNELSAIDTLRFKATYFKTDSLFNLFEVTDTFRLFYFERTQPTARRRDAADEEAKPSMPIATSIRNNSAVIPSRPLVLTFNAPLTQKDSSLFWLENVTDSLIVESFSLIKDTLNPRRYSIHYSWTNNVAFRLTAMPNAFTNINGISNDTLTLDFRGANPESFGKINFNLTGVEPNIIVDLITDKGVVVDSKIARKDSALNFEYVNPGTYFIRIIFDENQNEKWDTGNYLKGIQPEKVILYHEDNIPKEIQVRANWEYDINFNIKE